MNENKWYEEATRSRAKWRALCRSSVTAHPDGFKKLKVIEQLMMLCEVCCRKFRRESDKKRQEFLDESQKPVNKHRGTVQCHACLKWFEDLQFIDATHQIKL